MECPVCHTENSESNHFCENCGRALTLQCPACGLACAPQARFCGGCGASLVRSNLPGSNRPAATVQTGAGWGELKQATVLFADVVGSTELVANLDPEEAMGRLRPAVLRMRKSVERFGGTVVRTLGDGLMALFGVPRALEGHALLACQAALHMQKAFSGSNDGLTIRVGLHSGQVASDPQDAEDAHGGGAHGLTIHLASRVVALAEPGAICLTQACRAAAGPACEVFSIGSHQLKGIPGLSEILTLTDVRASALHRPASELAQTTFRGRQEEFARLVAALEQVQERTPRVVGIAGEAGAGKSRLCQEFGRLCAGRGIPVFEVRAQLHGHALPLQPILELFRIHFFGIGAGDDAATARARIAERCRPMQAAASDLALLYDFFGVSDPGDSPLALSPRPRQARLLALVKELVRQEADAARVILIEDLHWLDEASEAFISALVEGVAGTRTLLLLNYRLAYRPPWSQVDYFEQVDLGELPAQDMDALAAELLAPFTAVPDVCRLVCRRAAGNPFFAEELVRTLADSKLLAAETHLRAESFEALERALPATVEAVVGARLDRLGEPEKTLLHMCAIIGKEIPLAVLEHVASPLAAQIEVGLDGLCRAGLILPQPTGGARRFAFRHPLIQEVAYGSQLKVRRGQVHSSVATAMELYYSEQLDEYAGLIAYHYEAAQQHLAAARYMARAANWAASTHSARAISAWRKVRVLLQKRGPAPEVDRLKVMACGKIAWLSWREGLPMDEVMPFIEEARAIAGSDDARILRLLLFLEGRMLQANGGAVDQYVELVGQAMSLLDKDASVGSKVLLNTALCQAYGWAGMFTQALAASDAALQGARSVDKFEEDFIGYSLHQWALVLRGRLLTRIGEFAEAVESLQSVSTLQPHMVDPVLLQIAHYGLAEVGCLTGDMRSARHHSDVVARIAEQQGNSYLRVFGHASQALVYHAEERFGLAIAELRRAIDLVRRDNVAREFETELLVCLAESCYALQDTNSAEALSREAIALSEARNTRHQHIRALVIASAILRAKGSAEESSQSQALLQRAGELIRETGAGSMSFRVNAMPEKLFE